RIADSGNQSGRGMRAFTESNQGFGEVGIGVHRDVSGDVVKNIGLRQVIQASRLADRDGGRKLPIPQTIEKQKCRNVPRDRSCPKTSQRRQKAIHVFETRDTILGQAQRRTAVLKTRVGVWFPAWLEPLVKCAPCLVILGGIEFVGLLDV